MAARDRDWHTNAGRIVDDQVGVKTRHDRPAEWRREVGDSGVLPGDQVDRACVAGGPIAKCKCSIEPGFDRIERRGGIGTDPVERHPHIRRGTASRAVGNEDVSCGHAHVAARRMAG